MHLTQELLKNVQCNGSSRNFAKETRALKMTSAVSDHQKLTTTNWESSSKLILLKLHEKLPRNSTLTILWWFGIWSKLERWKTSVSGCFVSWLKNHHSEVIFSYSTQEQQTISQWDCDMWWKVVLCDNWQWPAQWLDQEEASKHFPKSNLHQKKKGHGPCLVVCCQSDPLQLSEYQQNHYIWEVCSANWSDVPKAACSPYWSTERAQFFCTAMPDCKPHNQLFRSWADWATEVCFICVFTWPLVIQLPLFQASRQLFTGKIRPQPAGGRKCFLRVCWILKHGFLWE